MIQRSRACVLTALSAAMLAACGGKEQVAEPTSLMEASRQELASALEERDQLLALVRDISTDMDNIKRLENIMTIEDAKGAECPSRRARLLADMSALRSTLDRRRRQLAELEARMQKSSLYTEELKGTVDMLRAQIETQSRELASLRRQLAEANTTIDSLASEVDSLHESVAAAHEERDAERAASTRLSAELNTCYYVAASRQELKRHRILETGFLRRSKLMKGEFDRGFFTVADKRSLRVIPLHTSKGTVRTTHPEGSYEITDSCGVKTLRVNDPERFWSLTNYLVVEVD